MENISVSILQDRIPEIDDMCNLLGMTRTQYLNHLFMWGTWVLHNSRVGKEIAVIDVQTRIYESMLNDPTLEVLKSSWVEAGALSKKK